MIYKNYLRIISECQGAFAEYAYQIAVKINDRKQVKEWEWNRLFLAWGKFYQAIPYKDRNTPTQLNKCLADLEELLDINNYPFVPIPLSNVRYIKTSSDPTLLTGPQGPPGSSANIDCLFDPDVTPLDEFQINIREDDDSGDALTKTFYFSLVQYLQPTVTLTVISSDGKVILEVGESKQILVTRGITVNSGDHPIVTKVYTAPGSSPDITAETSDSFLTAAVVKTSPTTQTYTTQVSDDKNTITKSDTMIWRYPILYGASANGSVNPYTLTKKKTGVNLDTYGDTQIAFNDSNKYFYFCYPEEYPDLEKILDGYPVGDDVLSGFTKSVVAVTSTGLNTNWTHNFKVYRTTNITDIIATYLFIFG